MIVGAISIIAVVLNFYFKKSRGLYFFLFLWMWIIMAFTSGIADEGIYISRYYNPQQWINSSELLYSAIIIACNKMGMDFATFKAMISGVQLMLIFSTVWRMASFPNLIMALYFLHPFPLNVAQMRNALATAIFIYGYKYLIDDRSEFSLKRIKLTDYDLKYIIIILVAACVHSASLIWLVLLIAKKTTLRKNIVFVIVSNLLIYFVLAPENIIVLLNKFGAGARLGAYFSVEYQQSVWRHYGAVLVQVLFTAFVVIAICAYIIKHSKKFINIEKIKLLLKANISILCILGIIFKYTGEVYRIQEGMTILNLMLITNSFKSQLFTRRKLSYNNAAMFGILLLYRIGIEYIAIILYLVPTIVLPILENNTLIKMIFG